MENSFKSKIKSIFSFLFRKQTLLAEPKEFAGKDLSNQELSQVLFDSVEIKKEDEKNHIFVEYEMIKNQEIELCDIPLKDLKKINMIFAQELKIKEHKLRVKLDKLSSLIEIKDV